MLFKIQFTISVMVQCTVMLAGAPIVVGLFPTLSAQSFQVLPCFVSVFHGLCCGFPFFLPYSQTFVSVLHCSSVAFKVLGAVLAEKTVRSYRHRSLPCRISLVREIKNSFIHLLGQLHDQCATRALQIKSTKRQTASLLMRIEMPWDGSIQPKSTIPLDKFDKYYSQKQASLYYFYISKNNPYS